MATIIDFLNAKNILWFPIILEFEEGVIEDPYTKTKEIKKIIKKVEHELYLHIKTDDKTNKRYTSYKPEYTDFINCTTEEIIERQNIINKFDFNAIWIDTRTYAQIDLDCPYDTINDTLIKESMDCYLKEYPYYKSISKPYGKHFFVKLEKPMDKNKYNFKTSLNQCFEKVDFLCGQGSYASIDATVNNYNKECDVWDDDYTNDYLFIAPISNKIDFKNTDVLKTTNKRNMDIETMTVGRETLTYNPNSISEEDLAFADIIDPKYIDNYIHWIKLMWACQDNYDLAVYISQRSLTKYKGLDDVKYHYDTYNVTKNMTKRTFYYYAKLSNKEEYFNIRKKNVLDLYDTSDNGIAKVFIHLYGDVHMVYDKTHYFFNGVYWQHNQSANKLKQTIKSDLLEIYKKEFNQLSNSYNSTLEDDKKDAIKKKRDAINAIITTITKNSTLKSVCDYIDIDIEKDKDEVQWNVKQPYYFTFKNRIYDLKNNHWVDTPQPTDYINMSTGYDYYEPKEHVKLQNELTDILTQIFPHDDERVLYMTILATGMVGITLDRFIIANGDGGNGKGVLNELACAMFGNYAYVCANNVLLKPLKQGSNPEVANMSGKRFIVYREPDERERLNMSSIKELTGGNEINARLNHSNDTKTLLVATHILEANKKPKIGGKIDNSISRRLIDMPFHSTFTNKPEECYGDYVFKSDAFFKTHEFQQKYSIPLFSLLLASLQPFLENNNDIEKFICQSVRDRTDEYINSSDEIYQWLQTRYEKSDSQTDVIKVKDIYDNFVNSDLWSKLTKKEQREMPLKHFKDYMSSHREYRKFYKDRCRERGKGIDNEICEKYGVIEMRNIIIGYKEKVITDEIEEPL